MPIDHQHSVARCAGRLLGWGLALSLGCAAHGDEILNGSFATGDFTDWTVSGYDHEDNVYAWFRGLGDVTNSPDATDVASIGPDETLYLSQTIATIPGVVYEFSFELAHTAYDGDAGAEFTASFGSDEVMDLLGGPPQSEGEASIYGQWQTESFLVEATSPDTTITFSFYSPPGYYLLTDVDPGPYVPDVPDGGVGIGYAAAVLLGLCGFSAGRLRRPLVRGWMAKSRRIGLTFPGSRL
jgi:hypothetical protein